VVILNKTAKLIAVPGLGIQYRPLSTSPLASIPSQLKPVHNLTICFNSIFPSLRFQSNALVTDVEGSSEGKKVIADGRQWVVLQPVFRTEGAKTLLIAREKS